MANANNFFLPYASSALEGQNIQSQNEYLASTDRTQGVRTGLANGDNFNKLAKQVSLMACAIAEFITSKLPEDTLIQDTLSMEQLASYTEEAIVKVILEKSPPPDFFGTKIIGADSELTDIYEIIEDGGYYIFKHLDNMPEWDDTSLVLLNVLKINTTTYYYLHYHSGYRSTGCYSGTYYVSSVTEDAVENFRLVPTFTFDGKCDVDNFLPGDNYTGALVYNSTEGTIKSANRNEVMLYENFSYGIGYIDDNNSSVTDANTLRPGLYQISKQLQNMPFPQEEEQYNLGLMYVSDTIQLFYPLSEQLNCGLAGKNPRIRLINGEWQDYTKEFRENKVLLDSKTTLEDSDGVVLQQGDNTLVSIPINTFKALLDIKDVEITENWTESPEGILYYKYDQIINGNTYHKMKMKGGMQIAAANDVLTMQIPEQKAFYGLIIDNVSSKLFPTMKYASQVITSPSLKVVYKKTTDRFYVEVKLNNTVTGGFVSVEVDGYIDIDPPKQEASPTPTAFDITGVTNNQINFTYTRGV